MHKIIGSAVAGAKHSMISEDQMLSTVNASEIAFAACGDNIFDLMIKAVATAKKQILIQTFVWDKRTPAIKNLQSKLKEIGEKRLADGDHTPLDVFVLIDELGSIAQAMYLKTAPKRWPHDAASLGLGDLPDNIHVHVGVHHHNDFSSTHSKTVIVDDQLLFITGANFQFSNYGADGNYDAALLIKGDVAKSAFYDFKNIWQTRSNYKEEDIEPMLINMSSNTNQQVILSNQSTVLCLASKPRRMSPENLLTSDPLTPDAVNNAIVAAIENATESIKIAMPNLNQHTIISKLADFINNKNGTVQLLMGLKFNEQREKWYGGTNEQTVETLFTQLHENKKNNLEVRWYSKNNEKPGVVHMKFMTFDDHVLFFGSSDLDQISLYHCHETNVMIDNKSFTQDAIKTLFQPAWQTSILAEQPSQLGKTFSTF